MIKNPLEQPHVAHFKQFFSGKGNVRLTFQNLAMHKNLQKPVVLLNPFPTFEAVMTPRNKMAALPLLSGVINHSIIAANYP